MQLIEAIKFGFKDYFNLKGVVGRTTFWYWSLFAFPVVFFDLFVLNTFVLTMAIIIPTFALLVRRLRDAGHGPGWLFVILITIPASIIGLSLGWGNYFEQTADSNIGLPVYFLFSTLFGAAIGFMVGLGSAGVILLTLAAMPTKTREQGNRYA